MRVRFSPGLLLDRSACYLISRSRSVDENKMALEYLLIKYFHIRGFCKNGIIKIPSPDEMDHNKFLIDMFEWGDENMDSEFMKKCRLAEHAFKDEFSLTN